MEEGLQRIYDRLHRNYVKTRPNDSGLRRCSFFDPSVKHGGPRPVEEMEKRMEFFDKIDKKDLDLDFELHELMDTVRKTARFFRKSSLKNDNLQIEVTKEIGKESKLLLDMKVRWNSMLFMLKSFVKVETPLLKGECVLYSFIIGFTEKNSLT